MAHKREVKMSNDERIAVLETTINHIDATLLGISQEIKRLNEKFDNKIDGINAKIDGLNTKMDNRFDKLNDRIWTLFFWMIGGFAGTLGILAHVQHWL
jgi:uncharacterized coiled-coil protein SlyX